VEHEIIQGNCNFTRFRFPVLADFNGRHFPRPASFLHATFHGEAQFAGATFERGCTFSSATFAQLATFEAASLTQHAFFSSAEFLAGASFTGANFPSGADFSHARFLDGCAFTGARFGDALATIRRAVRFDGATFEGLADLEHSTFYSPASFAVAQFNGEARFMRAAFHDETRFVGVIGAAGVFSRAEDTRLVSVTFSQPEKVTFDHVCLERTRFLGTDVRRVDFRDVQWRKRGGHCAAWDDLRLEDDTRKRYAATRRLYRQLKDNYERQRDPITAGDFHIGEMRMWRFSNPPAKWFLRFLKRNLSVLAVYQWVSQYGESYSRPLVWALVLILLFAALFARVPGLALQSITPAGATSLAGCPWQCLLHSAMHFLPLGGPFEPVHLAGHAVSGLERVIGAAVIAMFVLALNRRLKR
jgi:uncharacterized protein YjbI with pentapeptide repeats